MGAKLVLLDSTRPEDVCSTLQREKATFMPIVAQPAQEDCRPRKIEDYDLGSLKKGVCGRRGELPRADSERPTKR